MNIEKIREALETALNARERDTAHDGLLREALAELDKAQQGAEPVAWMRMHEGKTTVRKSKVYINDIPLYTNPPQAQQPGRVLTDKEVERLSIDFIANEEPNEWPTDWTNIPEGFRMGLRYARDNGYLAPAAGLTVDEVMEAVKQFAVPEDRYPYDCIIVNEDDVRTRLNAAINAKARKQ